MTTKTQRILFVDDEPNFLAGLRRMLRRYQEFWDLDFASGVDDALERITQSSYDVVVSDVNMPLKSGFDLLTALQESPGTKNIPVIILTGNAETDQKRRALDLGATDLLNKPVNEQDLVARLRSVLRLKSYQDALEAQNEILEEKVRERTLDLELARQDMVWRLAKAGEFRDEETGAHVIRVACYSRILASKRGLGTSVTDLVFRASPLHDIGKIGIPDSILLKSGPISPEERNTMQRHCEMGASILLEQPKAIRAFVDAKAPLAQSMNLDCGNDLRNMAAEIAMSHHERWDGTGYPRRLAQADIPVSGRIVALADVYDALRTRRSYKPAFDVPKTFAIMREGAGSHFDPDLFQTFELVVDDFEHVRSEYLD